MIPSSPASPGPDPLPPPDHQVDVPLRAPLTYEQRLRRALIRRTVTAVAGVAGVAGVMFGAGNIAKAAGMLKPEERDLGSVFLMGFALVLSAVMALGVVGLLLFLAGGAIYDAAKKDVGG